MSRNKYPDTAQVVGGGRLGVGGGDDRRPARLGGDTTDCSKTGYLDRYSFALTGRALLSQPVRRAFGVLGAVSLEGLTRPKKSNQGMDGQVRDARYWGVVFLERVMGTGDG